MNFLIKLCLSSFLILTQTLAFAFRYNLPDLEDNFKLEDIEYIETEDGDFIPINYIHKGVLKDDQYYAIPIMGPDLPIVIIVTLLIAGSAATYELQVNQQRVNDSIYRKNLYNEADKLSESMAISYKHQKLMRDKLNIDIAKDEIKNNKDLYDEAKKIQDRQIEEQRQKQKREEAINLIKDESLKIITEEKLQQYKANKEINKKEKNKPYNLNTTNNKPISVSFFSSSELDKLPKQEPSKKIRIKNPYGIPTAEDFFEENKDIDLTMLKSLIKTTPIEDIVSKVNKVKNDNTYTVMPRFYEYREDDSHVRNFGLLKQTPQYAVGEKSEKMFDVNKIISFDELRKLVEKELQVNEINHKFKRVEEIKLVLELLDILENATKESLKREQTEEKNKPYQKLVGNIKLVLKTNEHSQFDPSQYSLYNPFEVGVKGWAPKDQESIDNRELFMIK